MSSPRKLNRSIFKLSSNGGGGGGVCSIPKYGIIPTKHSQSRRGNNGKYGQTERVVEVCSLSWNVQVQGTNPHHNTKAIW